MRIHVDIVQSVLSQAPYDVEFERFDAPGDKYQHWKASRIPRTSWTTIAKNLPSITTDELATLRQALKIAGDPESPTFEQESDVLVQAFPQKEHPAVQESTQILINRQLWFQRWNAERS